MAISKNVKAARATVDREKLYSVEDAVKILQDAGKSRKIKQSVEIAVNLNVDPKHADQQVRGMTSLPNGTGVSLRVAVFARDEKAKEAKEAGADIVGAEDLAADIQAGKMDFDRCIASPDMMPLVGRLGKVLGPKGMMPNPKLGTVTPNVAEAVKAAKGGSIEFRAEKAGIIHAGVGKLDFSDKDLIENIRAFYEVVRRARPTGVKGTYVARVSLSSTMGPGIKIDLESIAA